MRRVGIVVLMVLATRLLIAGGGGGSFTRTFPPTDASWTRSASNPILSASQVWEGTAVQEVTTIRKDGATWKMWYRGGGWPATAKLALGYATASAPTGPWTHYASNPIYGAGGSGKIGSDGGSPRILLVGSTYYLYATNNADAPYHVNIATSSDGLTWTTQSSSISFASGCTLWGNREVWIEGATWYMLQEEYTSGSIWAIYLYTSSDGLTWSIANGGSALTSLRVAVGGSYGGPRFATVDGVLTPTRGGVYHLWYHAVNGTGNLPTDIYHATSTDKITWTWNGPVLTHLGTGFEIDQVAGPVPVVIGGISYLFYDGDDNASSAAKIGLAIGY